MQKTELHWVNLTREQEVNLPDTEDVTVILGDKYPVMLIDEKDIRIELPGKNSFYFKAAEKTLVTENNDNHKPFIVPENKVHKFNTIAPGQTSTQVLASILHPRMWK
jgi:hypothetical protein